jgi:hypothetical protein
MWQLGDHQPASSAGSTETTKASPMDCRVGAGRCIHSRVDLGQGDLGRARRLCGRRPAAPSWSWRCGSAAADRPARPRPRQEVLPSPIGQGDLGRAELVSMLRLDSNQPASSTRATDAKRPRRWTVSRELAGVSMRVGRAASVEDGSAWWLERTVLGNAHVQRGLELPCRLRTPDAIDVCPNMPLERTDCDWADDAIGCY